MLYKQPHGRIGLSRQLKDKPLGYVHILYTSRAWEWINIRKFFSECLLQNNWEHYNDQLGEIMFGWKHFPSFGSSVYQPKDTFCNFKIQDMFQTIPSCICLSKRCRLFTDPDTRHDHIQDGMDAISHVRTADLSFIHDHGLRKMLEYGLNHIPLQKTDIEEVITQLCDAWTQVAEMLQINRYDVAIGLVWVRQHARRQLFKALQENYHGFRQSHPSELTPTAGSELRFLLQYFYFAGLDKANNNICIICSWHIRLQAYKRLQGEDFLPWAVPNTDNAIQKCTKFVSESLGEVIPEIIWPHTSLPYIMASYKMHKKKYRWITNAAHCIFSGPASIMTQILNLVIVEIKVWANGKQQQMAGELLHTMSSWFWIIDSTFDFVLNMPTKISSIFVADITRCYESIPLTGMDNLPDALEYMVNIGFKQRAKNNIRRKELLWVHVDHQTALADKACWRQKCPGTSCWIAFDKTRILKLQSWLIHNCFLRLGDKVWRQHVGIPMGFSCSPLWCNLYLASYEIRFMHRLAKLALYQFMPLFQHTYRYIDDLCILNHHEILRFLQKSEPRSEDNPFWIYPLNVVDITPTIEKMHDIYPNRGIHGNFLNVDIKVLNSEDGSFATAKFDKRRLLPFTFQQYIQLASNRSINQCYNIAISQCVPIIYISSSVENALAEIQILSSTLEKNGFLRKRILFCLLRFCTNNHFPGARFSMKTLCQAIENLYHVCQTQQRKRKRRG